MQSASVLLTTAATIGLFHTAIGLDHTLPFVVLGRSRGWSLRKVWTVTGLCGLAHVLSSVVLGFVGIGIGVAVERLSWIESVRGGLAAWMLIAFGLVYAAWSWVAVLRGKRHAHVHVHADGTMHLHDHDHHGEHLHAHAPSARSLTFWGLFIVFAFGPCEPLIPLLMAPAWEHHWALVAAVAAIFSVATIGTMLALVTVGVLGLRMVSLAPLERYANVVAGLVIAASGLAIQVLGI